MLTLCRACAAVLEVPTMLLVGELDKYFYDEMWQRLDRHVRNCWLPAMLPNCSHWCPQDRHAPAPHHRQWHDARSQRIPCAHAARPAGCGTRSCGVWPPVLGKQYPKDAAACKPWHLASQRCVLHHTPTSRQRRADTLGAPCSPAAVNEHIRAFLGHAVQGFRADAGAPGGYPRLAREE